MLYKSLIGLQHSFGQAEWAKQHQVEYVFGNFLTDEFKPLSPLPSPPDALAIPGPPAPALSLLAFGTGKLKETLKTPDKVLKQWWDSSFATEFRDMIEAARQSHELDVKKEDESSGPANKKRRVMESENGKAETAGAEDAKESEIEAKEAADLPTLCYEAKVTCNPKLVVKVTIGQGVFLENTSSTDESIKAGVVLCGYYKGKFWSPDSTSEEPSEKSDVRFILQSDSDCVMLNSKYQQLSDIIKAKRHLTPADAHVSYHEIIDTPTPTNASAFKLEPKKMTVYFKVTDFPASVKSEEGESKLMIPAAHLAGTVPEKVWRDSKLADIAWAVKWPAVASKGLQPIRPMVVTSKQFVVKSKTAVMICKPNS